jgi:hypothetical protein
MKQRLIIGDLVPQDGTKLGKKKRYNEHSWSHDVRGEFQMN